MRFHLDTPYPIISGIVKAAKQANVPKYPRTSTKLCSREHQRLLDRRKKLCKLIANPDVTNKDKADMEEDIEDLNTKIQERHEQDRERRERDSKD